LENNKLSLPVKIECDFYSFDIAESEYDSQIALSPAAVKENGLNSEIIFVIIKYFIGF
jgi:hypothetical protein